MKRVRAYNPEDRSFTGTLHADNVNDETRHARILGCLNADCTATFHWVQAHRRHENTKEVPATFRRNKSSVHTEGCDFDYEILARQHRDLVFIKDGVPHLRINFPLGSSWTDRHPERGQLTKAQRTAAENNSNVISVSSLARMVNFIEKQYGSLENPALENLVLDYQGRSYPWDEIFVTAQQYTKLFNEAANPERDQARAMLSIVQPLREIARSRKGKRQFECEWQHGDTGKAEEKIRPLIVCETDSVAEKIEKAVKDKSPALIAARPFIVPSVLDNPQRYNIPVYLYAHSHQQAEPVKDTYWHYHPARQINMALKP